MILRRRTIQADMALLLASAIWGAAFVAQQDASRSLDATTILAIRFLMGSLILLPLVALRRLRRRHVPAPAGTLWLGGTLAGLAMLLGGFLQQKGVEGTSVSNAGFITGLYVLFVPLIGLLLGQRVGWSAWLGVLLAAAGLYLLCVTDQWQISRGDALVLACAAAWAIHVLVIGRYAPRCDPIELATVQFLVTGGAAALMLLGGSPPEWAVIRAAWMPLAYLGAFAVAVAFTLQVIGQRTAPPTHAAIILSMESPFAALAGAWLAAERLAPRQYLGCALMLAGILASQLLGTPLAAATEPVPAADR